MLCVHKSVLSDKGRAGCVNVVERVRYCHGSAVLFCQLSAPGASLYASRLAVVRACAVWKKPFTEVNHAKIVGSYFHYSAAWEIGVADVSPPGYVGERDPCIVVLGRKAKSD